MPVKPLNRLTTAVNAAIGLKILTSDAVTRSGSVILPMSGSGAQFVYVSVLTDVFTRIVRSWQLSQHLAEPLTLRPLEQALRQSVPVIHHSDQGVQYLSNTYISTLIGHGVEISSAHRGCPWENGYAERLVRTLHEEEVHLNEYDDIMDSRACIGHFIVQVYNQKRPNSARGYLTPVEFEQRLFCLNFAYL